MAKQSAEMGMNKTGIETAPKLSKEMIESSNNGPVSRSDGPSPEAMRTEYIKEGATIGSVPPPTSLKGTGKAALAALKGEKAAVLIDKLGERLAFERTGTRLYEALISKCRALGAADGDKLKELQRIRDQELEHFHLLRDCLKQLGADPTVETPSADVSALASEGIPKVLSDPRTTWAQSLQAILTAELVDNEGWEMLCKLAEEFKQSKMAEDFRRALAEEQNHLSVIRDWLTQEVRSEAQLMSA